MLFFCPIFFTFFFCEERLSLQEQNFSNHKSTPNKQFENSEVLRTSLNQNDILKNFQSVFEAMETLNETVLRAEKSVKTFQARINLLQANKNKEEKLLPGQRIEQSQLANNDNLAEQLFSALSAFRNTVKISSSEEKSNVMKIELSATTSKRPIMIENYINSTKNRTLHVVNLLVNIFEVLSAPRRNYDSLELPEVFKEFSASLESLQRDMDYPLEGIFNKLEYSLNQMLEQLKKI